MPHRYNRAELDPDFGDDPFGDKERRIIHMRQLRVGHVIEMVIPMLQPEPRLIRPHADPLIEVVVLKPELRLIAFINQTLRVHALDRTLPRIRECEHMPEPKANIIAGSVPPMIVQEGAIVFEDRTHNRHTGFDVDDPHRYTALNAVDLAVDPLIVPDSPPHYPDCYFRFVLCAAIEAGP